MKFLFPITIKSLDEILYFREFNFLEYKELQKVLLNNRFDAFNEYLTGLIEELCREDIDATELTFIERVKILLIICSYCVDQDKFLNTYEDGKKIKVDFNVYTVLDYFDIDIEDKTFNFKNFSIVLGNLNSTYSDKLGIFDFIQSVTILDTEYKYSDLDREVVNKLIDTLTSSEYFELEDYISDLVEENTHEIFILKNEDGEESELVFVYDKKSIFSLLSLLLKDNLSIIYKETFNINQIMNVSLDDLNHLTQREAKIFIQLHNKRMDDENKKEESKQKNIPTVHM
jgi:hypothetical protein